MTLYLAIDRFDGALWGVGRTAAEARDRAREDARPGEFEADEQARWERDLRVVSLLTIAADLDMPTDARAEHAVLALIERWAIAALRVGGDSYVGAHALDGQTREGGES